VTNATQPDDQSPERQHPERQSPQSWSDLDDTLADGPAPAEVPPESKAWLAEQRFVHGLLRALHTADANAREGRVRGVLERIDAAARGGLGSTRRWAAVAAAALVFAAAVLWLVLPSRLPTAEAAVQRAVAELARDVDRRYRLEIGASDRRGQQQARHEFDLVTRPGMRFRVDGSLAFGGVQLGEFTVGCDGHEVWLLPANGTFRRAAPLAERERLLAGFGDMLDLGYLDLHDLVRRLPECFDLRVVGRELGPDGRPVLRIEAANARAAAHGRLRSAELVVDEATSMVTQIEARATGPSGFERTLRFRYLGEEPAGRVDYRRPW
jgi:hypothetical protein